MDFGVYSSSLGRCRHSLSGIIYTFTSNEDMVKTIMSTQLH